MYTVLISGGTGLVGNALSEYLISKGFHIIILSRKKKYASILQPSISYAQWDVVNQTIDIEAIQKADYIIHLAGAPVMEKKWTQAYKKEIANSRSQSSELIINALQNNPNKVKAIISASAIGWYGIDKNRNNTKGFIETDKSASGFLGATCQLWEDSIEPATTMGIRLVKFRIGIVLSNNGGALSEFKKSLSMGVAAILGNGKQIISWIHIDDLCRLFHKAIEQEILQGVYNAVAPTPVSNKKLMLQLASFLRGKFFIPVHVPSFLLKIILGQRSIEVLKSTTVSCEKIKQTGFTFLYPSIEAAFYQLCKK